MSTEEKAKVRVTPKMILGMLEVGKDRKAIGEELGLSQADVKRMFQHPELKNKKVKKFVEPGFVWAEDEEASMDAMIFEEEPEQAVPAGEVQEIMELEEDETATWPTEIKIK